MILIKDVINIDTYSLGERLKEVRESRNLSQAAVAERIEVTNAAISAYELNTSTPSLETFIKLALFFNVSADYLLGLDKRNIVRAKILPQEQQKKILTLLNIVEDLTTSEK